jgi:site-specific DNA-methyltransferase (cytosine-N4-specific)
MLHPHLVDFLIDNYANKNDIVFDPFCGSGVTLLQSSIKQHESIGFDINPLSLLISKVKSTNFDIQKLRNEFNDLKTNIVSCSNIDIPDINNIDYLFSPTILWLGFSLKNRLSLL